MAQEINIEIIEDESYGLKDSQRERLGEVLHKVLADEIVLYQMLRNFHWNVKGMHFKQLHELFEEQYTDIEEIIDEVAERISTLGMHTEGRLNELLAISRIEEPNETNYSESDMLTILIESTEKLVKNLKKDLRTAGDDLEERGVEDLLTGIMQKHMKASWMLKSHMD